MGKNRTSQKLKSSDIHKRSEPTGHTPVLGSDRISTCGSRDLHGNYCRGNRCHGRETATRMDALLETPWHRFEAVWGLRRGKGLVSCTRRSTTYFHNKHQEEILCFQARAQEKEEPFWMHPKVLFQQGPPQRILPKQGSTDLCKENPQAMMLWHLSRRKRCAAPASSSLLLWKTNI